MSETATQEPKHTFLTFENGATEGDWDLEEKIFQADHSYKCPTYVHKTPPCQGSCPSGHEIRGWLAIARGMDKPPVEGMAWQEYAFQRMVAANPFPSTMGRVCPAPCEDGCNRNEVDEYVGINAVEQYVGDWANENHLKLSKPGADSGKKVAVIGGGPAGLAAAYFLRVDGHAVTIFEANEDLGGMMRYGIPGYRTPHEMLDIEIGRIGEMGCDIKLNTRIGEDVEAGTLEDDYDAVFWAIGAQNGRDLPVEGWEGTDNCISGVEFLDAFNKGWVKGTAQKVVVVGGGDTSIDVASVARRLGHITHNAEKEHPTGSVIEVIRRLPAQKPLITRAVIGSSRHLLPDRIHFPSSDKNLELSYSTPSFFNEQGQFYRYRMLGLEEAWSAETQEHSVRYAYLPPGGYQFEVQSRQNHGDWDAPIARLQVDVLPTFWQTMFAKIILLSVLIALGFLISIMRLKRVETLRRRLKRLVRDQTRKIRDQRDKLAELATIDELTGLPNRRKFEERLEMELVRCRRKQSSISLFFFDIDNFKEVNDTFGHITGDRVLKIIADMGKAAIRDIDFLARWAGDEFVLFMPETDLAGGIEAADRFKSAVQKFPCVLSDTEQVAFTISGGVTAWKVRQNGGQQITELIEEADLALYKAKESGGNKICS